MNNPIPLRRTRKPGGQDVWSEAREMAQMLNGRFGGYTIIATTDPVTSERLCAEIARVFASGEDLYGLQGGPSWVVDAAQANDPVHEAASAGIDGLVRVPTRPGLDLDEWAKEIRSQRPRLVLGGTIAAERMAHIKALETVRMPVLLTAPVYGHARAVDWLREQAREAGVPFEAESVADTIEAVGAYETCDACHGFCLRRTRQMSLG